VNKTRFCRKKKSCKSRIYSFLNDLTLIFVVPIEQISNSFLEDLKLLAKLAA